MSEAGDSFTQECDCTEQSGVEVVGVGNLAGEDAVGGHRGFGVEAVELGVVVLDVEERRRRLGHHPVVVQGADDAEVACARKKVEVSFCSLDGGRVHPSR